MNRDPKIQTRSLAKVLLVLLGTLLFCQSAMAARTVHFVGSALNSTDTTDAVSDVTSSFVINITNPSQQTQTYTLTVTGTCASGGVNCGGGTNATADGSNPRNQGTQYTLAAGATDSYIYSFPAFTAATVGTQSLTITGTIQVTDTSTTLPGFIIASGNIISYTQTIRAGTVVGGTPYMRGAMIPVQKEISIGEGRPL